MKRTRVNHVGKYYGNLYVLKQVGVDRLHNRLFLALCECGKMQVYQAARFHAKPLSCRAVRCASCGHKENARKKTTHGMARTHDYSGWTLMKQRCENPKHDNYEHYGARGIKVCERWQSFENFYEDMGPRKAGMTIDRIDPNGDYCPENCRWATNTQQCRNKTNNRWLVVNGVRKTAAEWCEIYEMPTTTLFSRLSKGWSDERAVTQPRQKKIARK